ncbi:hypothetical protein QQ056_07840 [Oscillatoria laete-virens NRMC-F 0139]|nr:hypothetical protein [Oscillatoria laete-virens]MDL5053452.1 hypothetical protein [Oscillatoria laete-virens NRMC-F 0139]
MPAENLDRNSPRINFKIIADEIKQLQRKLEETVQPYQRPIFSILPEERQVGVKVAKLQRSATRRLELNSSEDSRKIFYFSIHPEVLEATWC